MEQSEINLEKENIKNINSNINQVTQLLNEVTINELKDISSMIINIENDIRNVPVINQTKNY